jgi:hypothetical protein
MTISFVWPADCRRVVKGADTAPPTEWAASAQISHRPVSVPVIGGGVVSTDLIARAQEGDEDAFRQLVDPHQRELEVHCYRILGSAQDAEDALQETLLTAWQSLGGFEPPSAPGCTGSRPAVA